MYFVMTKICKLTILHIQYNKKEDEKYKFFNFVF